MNPTFPRIWKPLSFVVLAAACLPACNPNTVSGVVYNVQGEPLPGVVVNVEGSRYQTLSNARGAYRVHFDDPPVVLSYGKTGYTPGVLTIDEPESLRVEAAPVHLWNLPQGKGVYFYRNHRYYDLMRIEPNKYSAQGLGQIYGTTEWCDVEISDRQPAILCYKLPEASASLCEMNLLSIEPAEAGQAGTLDVWTRSRNIPVGVVPIDEPEGLLLQLSLPEPLEPGVYAVHWGALDGAPIPESRMFMFTVVDPETRVQAPPESGENPEEPPAKNGANEPRPGERENIIEFGDDGEMSG